MAKMLIKNKYLYQLNKNALSYEEILTFDIIAKGSKVLEIGCNAGLFSKYLKQNKNVTITVVDIDYRVAEIAKKNVDNLVIGDIENADVLDKIKNYGPFNYIILLHILEHLIDPWKLVIKLKYLSSPNAKILCAVPNIANWNSRALLFFKGRWVYEETGIMDRTHLRFFTIKTFKELFETTNLVIDNIQYLNANIPLVDNINFLRKIRSSFIPVTKKMFPPSLWATSMFVVVSKKGRLL